MELYKMRAYAPEGAVFIIRISFTCLIVTAGCVFLAFQPFFSLL